MFDPQRHADSRNTLENLLRQIPGFRGYLAREERRDSDYLARTWLADQLQKCKSSLDTWQRSLLDEGQIDLLPLCERLRTRVDTLQAQIKGAMRGYSGFFDFVKVDEGLLEQVYELDMGLVGEATVITDGFQQLPAAGGSPQERISALNRQLDEFSRGFEKRGELLAGIH